MQRFGPAANVRVHAPVLMMDGVFTAAESGKLTFHKLPSPKFGAQKPWPRSSALSRAASTLKWG